VARRSAFNHRFNRCEGDPRVLGRHSRPKDRTSSTKLEITFGHAFDTVRYRRPNGDGLWIRCAIRELAFPPRQGAARSSLFARRGGEPLRSGTIINGAIRDVLELTRDEVMCHCA
jgi:hypothetical protein